jgi:hypothetical protein
MAVWSIVQPFGIFCSHSVNFMVIWNIFSPILVHCSKKNLATLVERVLGKCKLFGLCVCVPGTLDAHSLKEGVPDFSWYNIPKWGGKYPK